MSEDEALAFLASVDVPAQLVVKNSLQHLVRVPSFLGGVTYRYLGQVRKGEVMNPRTAVMLYRLGQALAAKRVSYVDHMGIFPGSGTDPETMHNRGYAADISGFVFADGSKISVTNDWSKKPTFFKYVYDALCAEAECDAVGGGNYLITPGHRDPALASSHRDHFHAQVDHTRNWNPLATQNSSTRA